MGIFYQPNLLVSTLKKGLLWTLSLAFFIFIRFYGIENFNGINPIDNLGLSMPLLLILGLIFGFSFTLLEKFYYKRFSHKTSFGKVVLISIFYYIITLCLLLFILFLFFLKQSHQPFSLTNLEKFFFDDSITTFLVFIFVTTCIFGFFKQMDRKFGPGNMFKMLKGDFYSPKEETRIFMFLDLNSSTSIAEELGHVRYSQLLQDCFHDVSIVQKYKAEIYQYVGDEVVLTWPIKNGIDNNNVIQAYFAFIDVLAKRKDYYFSQYGFLPSFKAGVHFGKVTVTEVGEVKREIAFHGDVLNTASRIQGKCNEIGELFLVSSEFANLSHRPSTITFKSIGEIYLKGKNNKMKICAVKRNSENINLNQNNLNQLEYIKC
ncbi:adenylate/guanylate cyclase domain-containing protein [Flexithrix dorotheae]|uniref:adenylate/guanylate cyclase domain-containing protein n=1 Tax=Flexithrix dorotheae TaxID=70993 RepID=UPI000379CF14|nr:adenylate/guanylate cyclase domain-containing protein [Flexithrix dorotheae]